MVTTPVTPWFRWSCGTREGEEEGAVQCGAAWGGAGQGGPEGRWGGGGRGTQQGVDVAGNCAGGQEAGTRQGGGEAGGGGARRGRGESV